MREESMASYPSPHRDPLIDSRLQQVLNQRGKELLGLGMIAGALVLALILGSYSPQDPGWMAATDAPVRNAFGRVFRGLKVTREPHVQFKKRVPGAIGLIRTGDATPYGNLIIESA